MSILKSSSKFPLASVDFLPNMIFENTLHDPLSINLPGQTRILLSTVPSTSQHYERLISASNPRQLLDALSTCLAVPSCTAIIAKLFRPLLMDLCARWMDDSQQYEDHFVALSYLVEIHEELFPYVFRVSSCNFSELLLAFLIDCSSHILKEAHLHHSFHPHLHGLMLIPFVCTGPYLHTTEYCKSIVNFLIIYCGH